MCTAHSIFRYNSAQTLSVLSIFFFYALPSFQNAGLNYTEDNYKDYTFRFMVTPFKQLVWGTFLELGHTYIRIYLSINCRSRKLGFMVRGWLANSKRCDLQIFRWGPREKMAKNGPKMPKIQSKKSFADLCLSGSRCD